MTALKQREQDQDADRAAAGELWEAYALVFTTRLGSPIDPRDFNRAFTSRCVTTGVPVITVHDARRTCASLLVDLDVLVS